MGPDALTHRLVAGEAGLPLASTTYWFASKEELVHAAFVRATERDLEHLADVRERAARWTKATAAAELARMIEEACTTRREDSIIGSALWVDAVRRPGLRPFAQRWTDAYVEFYAFVLERVGAGRAPYPAARLLSAVVDGLVGQQLATDAPLDATALVEVLEPVLQMATHARAS